MKLILLLSFILISCNETSPELKSLGENDINESKNFEIDKTTYYINDPSENLSITGKCDPRYKNMEASFDNGKTWKTFSEIGTAETEDDCSDHKFTIYLDAINNFFTYETGVVGNQTKKLKIRGNLGFTYSTPKTISISNGDFLPPATPAIRTLSSFAFARIYIDPIADKDFSHFQCKVDNGSWFACENDQVITTDGSTITEVGKRHNISVRSVDLSGNASEVVTKPFIRGKIGRGVSGPVHDILEYKKGQYLIAGDFNYYESTPTSSIARFNIDDFSLDKTWNPDFSSLGNYDPEHIFYDETNKYYIVVSRNHGYIFDENWIYINKDDIVDGGPTSSSFNPQFKNGYFYTMYTSTRHFYRSYIDNSTPSTPIIVTEPNILDYGAIHTSSSFYIGDNYIYMRAGQGTQSDFCLKRFNIDLSDHSIGGTNIICNNPNDFTIGPYTIGVDNPSTAFIGRSIGIKGDDLYFGGDFDGFQGSPVPNCILKYDGNTITPFGHDLGFSPSFYGSAPYNYCIRASVLNIMDNDILVERFIDSSLSTSDTIKINLTTGIQDSSYDKDRYLSTKITPLKQNYLHSNVVYDDDGNQVYSLKNITNYSNAKSFYHNNFLYLFYNTSYANHLEKKSTNLILVDETGNILKIFSTESVRINKIYKHQDKIYLAGSISKFEDKNYKNLLRLNMDLEVDETFPNLNFNNEVTDLVYDSSGRLYVTGSFTTMKDVSGVTQTKKNLVRFKSNLLFDDFLTLNTTTISSAGSYQTGTKLLLDETDPDPSKHSLYLSGNFTSDVEGHPTERIVKIFLSNSIDTTFSIAEPGVINDLDLAPNNQDLIISRSYSGTGLLSGSTCEICVINKNTGDLVTSLYDSSKDIWETIIKDNYIYSIGERVFKFDANYNLVQDYDSLYNYNYYRRFVLNDNNELIIGGQFETFENNPRINLLKLNSDFSLNQYSFGDWR